MRKEKRNPAPDPLRLRAALLSHFRRHRRDLPWRRTHDPYAILVSEVMLQQTRVETVKARYDGFLRRFPSVEDLARASETRVIEAWAGLGYYRRARNLRAAAREIVRRGGFPRSARDLEALPGVGRYTAGAVASIAFREPTPVVDGNVARVLSRLRALPAIGAGDPRLWALAGELARGPAPGDVNQALMELGATVCLPRAPRCGPCPLSRWCEAHRACRTDSYPSPACRPARRTMRIAFALVRDPRGVWLERRPLDGLWPGLWEPPSEAGNGARRRLERRLGARLLGPVARLSHDLSHRRVLASVYVALRGGGLRATTCRRYFADPLLAPTSSLARKVLRSAPGAVTPAAGRGTG